MKIEVIENEGCFGISIGAETMLEAALLVRLGMNATAEIRHFATDARKCGEFSTAIVFGKAKNADGSVPNRNRKSRRMA